jgi:hypothetical protein
MSETTYEDKETSNAKKTINKQYISTVLKKTCFILMTVASSAAVLFFEKKYIQRFDRHLTVPVPVHARRRTGIKFGIEQHYLVALPVTASCLF